MSSYHTIWTHRKPDLDGLCAAWLLKKFGEDKFPGISQAEIKFVENQEELEEKDLESAVIVDMGRGQFDHHSSSESECAATLVAKKLGVAHKDGLKGLLEFVKNTDLQGAHNRYDISYITKSISKYLEPQKAVIFAFTALEAEYQRQKRYREAELELIEAKTEVIPVGGKKIKLVKVQSDNPEITKAASAKLKADMIIKKESSGNTQLFTYRDGRSLNLDRLVRALRYAEYLSSGKEEEPQLGKITEDDHLSRKWYYWKRGNGIFNGSNTAKVEPTNLDLDQITSLTKKFLDKSKLPAECPANPEEGESSCKLSGCSWYKLQLPWCKKIRNAIH